MVDYFGGLHITSCNNDTLSNTSIGDIVIYTETSQQAMHLGASGSTPALSITSNNIIIDRHIIPASDTSIDLGSSTSQFRDLYLSGNTLHLGGARLKNDGGNNIIISDSNQSLKNLVVDKLIIGDSNTGEIVTLQQSKRGTLDIASSTGMPTDITASNVIASNITFGVQTLASSNNSQTQPSYSWQQDPSTGLYQPNSNSIGFTTNGVHIATLCNTGLNIEGSLSTNMLLIRQSL
jgi:hypothetical protein